MLCTRFSADCPSVRAAADFSALLSCLSNCSIILVDAAMRVVKACTTGASCIPNPVAPPDAYGFPPTPPPKPGVCQPAGVPPPPAPNEGVGAVVYLGGGAIYAGGGLYASGTPTGGMSRCPHPRSGITPLPDPYEPPPTPPLKAGVCQPAGVPQPPAPKMCVGAGG